MSIGGDATMGLRHRLAAGVTDVLAFVLPKGLLRSLAASMARRDPGIFTSTVTTAERFLAEVNVPQRVNGFEDLSFLFWRTPMNRGILRQDFDEAAALYRLVKSMSNPRGVEIGRYAGGSTILIAAALCYNAGFLTSIDIAPRDDEQLLAVLAKLELSDRVDLVVANAATFDLGQPLDFVFIDGDHSYEGARNDHMRWGGLVKVGGYIIHHDMGQARPHSTSIADLVELGRDIARHQAGELDRVLEIGSLVVYRRTSESWTAFARGV
jgi:predicted O-methyltransferase YrrM